MQSVLLSIIYLMNEICVYKFEHKQKKTTFVYKTYGGAKFFIFLGALAALLLRGYLKGTFYVWKFL